MICVIDNYDSFTYNLVNYVKKTGRDVEIFSNDFEFSKIDFTKYNGIILSPGPSTPENAGITLDVIKKIKDIPMLGVCLGMQSIGYIFGAKIIHSRRTMHGKIDTIRHSGGDLFKDVPEEIKAVRYHSLAVSEQDLPDCLEVKALASDGEIMAIRHKTLPIWGVQYHPESYLTEYGMKIIENFIGGCCE